MSKQLLKQHQAAYKKALNGLSELIEFENEFKLPGFEKRIERLQSAMKLL